MLILMQARLQHSLAATWMMKSIGITIVVISNLLSPCSHRRIQYHRLFVTVSPSSCPASLLSVRQWAYASTPSSAVANKHHMFEIAPMLRTAFSLIGPNRYHRHDMKTSLQFCSITASPLTPPPFIHSFIHPSIHPSIRSFIPSFHVIPFHPSHLIPSHPIPSHPIPSIQSVSQSDDSTSELHAAENTQPQQSCGSGRQIGRTGVFVTWACFVIDFSWA